MKKLIILGATAISFTLMSFQISIGTVAMQEDVPYSFSTKLKVTEMDYDVEAAGTVVACPGQGSPCSIEIEIDGTTYKVTNGKYNKDKYPKKVTVLAL